jgi:serine/threonine protein kinase
VITENNAISVVMKQMKCDLNNFLKKNGDKLSLRRKVLLALRCLDLLGYLRRCRVIHNDIKATNLLMDDKGLLHLADFGFGQRMYPCASKSTHCKFGSERRGWSPRHPQIHYNAATVNANSDVDFFGVTFVALEIMLWNSAALDKLRATRVLNQDLCRAAVDTDLCAPFFRVSANVIEDFGEGESVEQLRATLLQILSSVEKTPAITTRCLKPPLHCVATLRVSEKKRKANNLPVFAGERGRRDGTAIPVVVVPRTADARPTAFAPVLAVGGSEGAGTTIFTTNTNNNWCSARALKLQRIVYARRTNELK